jgi:hypothetical protein
MKYIFLFLSLLVTAAAQAQSYSGPESVTYDAATRRYFISNNNANQILARDSSGVLTVFTSAITSGPHGLEIVGNTLYACDGSSMKGFDLTTAAVVMNLNVGATFLNGICTDGVNTIYTTDFTAKKIFKIDIAAQTYTVFVTGLAKSPNGIIYDGANQRIIWVTWGTNAPIMEAQLSDSSVSQVTATTLGNCDGIDRDGTGNYYVSAWNTQSIYRFDSSFTATPVAVVSGLSSPADIYYNLTNDSLVCPNAGNNTVTFHYMGAAAAVKENTRNQISVYPNPASRDLHIAGIAMNVKHITVFSSTGQEIIELNFENINSVFKETIDVSALYPGIYFVKISGDQDAYVIKFVKEY